MASGAPRAALMAAASNRVRRSEATGSAEEWEARRQAVLRSIRFHLREQRKREGQPVLRLERAEEGQRQAAGARTA